ncbi:glycosyltransferase [Chitinophaga sp. Cy-1792]|uniref:glycosyltransferase n=1 Tax=Chitinophaga sp. Cy-1792 TaxID=2608339 RepID=UPI00141EA366|nr:glycosyltransferase [Chitinophaga sp. Cy-1792]NIG55226.1 glycosyltransferase [Chitinophaga sp. Cy-1792]
MNNRKILFVITSLGFGGAESQLLGIIPALADRGYDISLLTIKTDLGLISRLDRRAKHYDLGVKGVKSMPGALRKLNAIIKEVKPDIVHTHLFHANLLGRFIKMRHAGIRVINTTHSNYDSHSRAISPYLCYRLTSKWVDYHSAVSVPALRALQSKSGIRKERSGVIYNAIDVDSFINTGVRVDPPVFKWVAIGRLIEVKDYRNLFDAMQLLLPSGVAFTLDIAGDGDLKNELKAQVELAGLNRHVRFLGLVKNIAQMLPDYDGYVISSRSEGMPMALLEAMSAGLPVTGTDVGGIRSIVEGADGGIVVPARDPVGLSNGMMQLMKMNPLMRQRLGERNAAYVRNNFAKARILDFWEDIYENRIAVTA